MVKTPLEDFTTEILCGILSSDGTMGDLFVNEVLKITGHGFTFATQQFFPSPDPNHPDCRIDMMVRSDELICFVEHKVEAREGYIQLERYAHVLDLIGDAEGTTTHLQYCTKYYDDKPATGHNFHQFRWADVYRFLLPYRNKGIINEYLHFLKTHDMSDELNFSLADLTTMQGLNPIVNKLELYLQRLRPVFGRYFDASRIKDSKNLGQIKNHSRYVFHTDNIFGEGYAELGAGFYFEDAPRLKVWIWISDKHNKRAAFKTALHQTELLNNGETWLGVQKPLSDFISAERMDEQIETWFAEAFQTIKTFKNSHPELQWHI